MADEFEGFANAVNPKGEAYDAREVPAYVDESDAGKIRDASISTPSSITEFKTEGKGTNGAPMAVVPAPKDEDSEDNASDADAAGGEEDTDSDGDETPVEPASTES